jgi:hypothetical protein
VEFSTQSEVQLSMRVTMYIYFFDYYLLHRAQFQYADINIEILLKFNSQPRLSCRYF